MRISSGEYRGRILRVPRTGLRPTSEKVRQALFDVLGPLEGWRVLDLYAGSGAVGFEALSRGAAHACFVEADRRAVASIRGNAQLLRREVEIQPVRVAAYLKRSHPGVFDLVFLDPPYQDDGEKEMLSGAPVSEFLAPGGVLVFECSSRENPPVFSGLDAGPVRKYGETCLHFFSKAGTSCESSPDMV